MLFESVGQWPVFLACIYGGLAIGLVYDLMGIVRSAAGRGLLITAAADISFWMLAGAIILIVSVLANDGDIRLYMALGFGAGYLLFKSAVTPIVNFMTEKISGAFKRAVKWFRSTSFGKNMLK
ncbi:MAG: spore cortex biosynthesis protein YabQ [Christensenellales bacterium]|jgi:spore cortex biosynthesis protein YabQ